MKFVTLSKAKGLPENGGRFFGASPLRMTGSGGL